LVPLAWGTAWEALWGLLAFEAEKIFRFAKSSMRSEMEDRLGSPLGAAGFKYLRVSHFLVVVGLSGKKKYPTH